MCKMWEIIYTSAKNIYMSIGFMCIMTRNNWQFGFLHVY